MTPVDFSVVNPMGSTMLSLAVKDIRQVNIFPLSAGLSSFTATLVKVVRAPSTTSVALPLSMVLPSYHWMLGFLAVLPYFSTLHSSLAESPSLNSEFADLLVVTAKLSETEQIAQFDKPNQSNLRPWIIGYYLHWFDGLIM